MLAVDCPASSRDDAGRRIDHREIDLVQCRDAVEERRSIRRRLGEDRRDANRVPRGGESPEASPPRPHGFDAAPVPGAHAWQRHARGDPRRGRSHFGRATRERHRARRARGAREPSPRSGAPVRVRFASSALFLRTAREARGRGLPPPPRRPQQVPGGSRISRRARPVASRARSHDRDLVESNTTSQLLLQLRSTLRRLARVKPVEDKGFLQAVRLGVRKHAGPELVVLTLAEGLVVAEVVPLEECPVECDGVVEERRAAEQRVPARHCTPRLWKVNVPQSSVGDELEDTGPHQRDVGTRPEPRRVRARASTGARCRPRPSSRRTVLARRRGLG